MSVELITEVLLAKDIIKVTYQGHKEQHLVGEEVMT